jgi:hypothetical protein
VRWRFRLSFDRALNEIHLDLASVVANPTGIRLGQRPLGGFAGVLLVFGIDDKAPAHPFAFALRVQIGLIAQGQVDDAALAR